MLQPQRQVDHRTSKDDAPKNHRSQIHKVSWNILEKRALSSQLQSCTIDGLDGRYGEWLCENECDIKLGRISFLHLPESGWVLRGEAKFFVSAKIGSSQ